MSKPKKDTRTSNEKYWDEYKGRFPFHFIQDTFRRPEFYPEKVEQGIIGKVLRVHLPRCRTAWGFESQEDLDQFKALPGVVEATSE